MGTSEVFYTERQLLCPPFLAILDVLRLDEPGLAAN